MVASSLGPRRGMRCPARLADARGHELRPNSITLDLAMSGAGFDSLRSRGSPPGEELALGLVLDGALDAPSLTTLMVFWALAFDV
jgi:hypothetical protein